MTTTAAVNTPDTQLSLSAILAQTIGRMSNWTNIMPPLEHAEHAFSQMPVDLQQMLTDRAARHGMDAADLIQRAPRQLWENPEAFETFLGMVDVSHIKSVSEFPHLANDPNNVIWELISTNRARGAETMTGVEFADANDTTREIATDLTGMDWWTLNDVFKNMLSAAGAIGYTVAWLPKEVWKDMMSTIQEELPLINQEKTFSGKYKRARAFALKAFRFFKKTRHQVAAAFMLGCLTLLWPPATFFVGAWAMTGVLATVAHMFRNQLTNVATKVDFLSFLRHFNVPLESFEWIMNQARSFLDSIKNGMFRLVSKAMDLFFGTLEIAAKVVKPFVQKIIKSAKNILDGFIGWVRGLFGQQRLAAA